MVVSPRRDLLGIYDVTDRQMNRSRWIVGVVRDVFELGISVVCLNVRQGIEVLNCLILAVQLCFPGGSRR